MKYVFKGSNTHLVDPPDRKKYFISFHKNNGARKTLKKKVQFEPLNWIPLADCVEFWTSFYWSWTAPLYGLLHGWDKENAISPRKKVVQVGGISFVRSYVCLVAMTVAVGGGGGGNDAGNGWCSYYSFSRFGKWYKSNDDNTFVWSCVLCKYVSMSVCARRGVLNFNILHYQHAHNVS